jgi:SAM-dependent methyltransferase
VLFDYSRSLLSEARARRGEAGPGGRPRYLYVAGDFYAFPFAHHVFDSVTMVRVIHHAQDVARVLQGINEMMLPGGTFLLEFANKRNLKAITRWALKQQSWNPFNITPYEFAELNFDFHPLWMQRHLEQAGFAIEAVRAVSHFRIGAVKRIVPTRWLAKLDGWLQPIGRWWQLTPSVFVKSTARGVNATAEAGSLFRCPVCRSVKMVQTARIVHCQDCHRAWSTQDGLFDFKAPL